MNKAEGNFDLDTSVIVSSNSKKKKKVEQDKPTEVKQKRKVLETVGTLQKDARQQIKTGLKSTRKRQ